MSHPKGRVPLSQRVESHKHAFLDYLTEHPAKNNVELYNMEINFISKEIELAENDGYDFQKKFTGVAITSTQQRQYDHRTRILISLIEYRIVIRRQLEDAIKKAEIGAAKTDEEKAALIAKMEKEESDRIRISNRHVEGRMHSKFLRGVEPERMKYTFDE